MMKLMPLSREAVERALEKAEHYRLLSEPVEAESICRDVLDVDGKNQRAIIGLILSLTDQFRDMANPQAFTEAVRLVARLKDDYNKAYYSGIIFERRAKAHLNYDIPGSGFTAYGWLKKAMDSFQKAIELCKEEGICDAILRWNTCVRILTHNPDIASTPETVESVITEDNPAGAWRAR
ncbi:MAG: hypothetical protein WC202_13200 [Desulfobacterales bacterium]|jgi:hypothetical protein